MRRFWQFHRPTALAVTVTGAVLALAGQGLMTLSPAAASVPKPVSSMGVKPRAIGGLDCNGLSPIQRPAKPGLQCADPHGSDGGRLVDNGHYIGHHEPSVRFISNAAGSGADTRWPERLPRDPKALPTVAHPGKDVTLWFELSLAPWFSTTVCDPQSAPLLPCNPRSDANAPHGRYPGGGAAFVELQFYPPGFAPFADSISCDNTHWCSALTIDSLECTTNFGHCNPNCIEPVNFGFIQADGVPTGPPSPQLANLSTFSPNAKTLLMNSGDRIQAHIFDADIGGGGLALETRVTDLTTGQSGFMVASAANGFMNTNIGNCKGTPFNFQP